MNMPKLFGTDERAASTAIGYTLTLGITTLLITGLLFASGGFVEDKRQESIRSELRVIGQQAAAEIQAGDRLSQTTDEPFTLTRDLPDTVSGSTYTIEVVAPTQTETYLEIISDNPEVVVKIDMALQEPIRETAFAGGELRVRYDAGPDELVVSNG